MSSFISPGGRRGWRWKRRGYDGSHLTPYTRATRRASSRRCSLSRRRPTMVPRLVLLLLTVCWLGAPSPTLAQTWPSKPIRIIAPFPPGGSVDQVSRILGAQLTTQLGQQVIVDNRGGASGSIGTAAAAKSAPDGYTFVVVFDTHGVNPSLIQNLPFDTLRDLAPVMLIGTSPMVLAANRNAPFKTFKDVVAAAKVKGSPVSFGSIGSGSLGHLAMTQLANQ